MISPALRRFAEAHPRTEISLTCAPSPDLLAALAAGQIDLAVLEEPAGPTSGERLRVERLVWIGARGGAAHLRAPLPVSLVQDTCAFRPSIVEALTNQGLPWRIAFENGSLDANTGSVLADLAVTARLESTVPDSAEILDGVASLPPLPPFSINLHLGPAAPPRARDEMARFLREHLRA